MITSCCLVQLNIGNRLVLVKRNSSTAFCLTANFSMPVLALLVVFYGKTPNDSREELTLKAFDIDTKRHQNKRMTRWLNCMKLRLKNKNNIRTIF